MNRSKTTSLFLLIHFYMVQSIFAMDITGIKEHSTSPFFHAIHSLIDSVRNASKKIEEYRQRMVEEQSSNLPMDDCNLPIESSYDSNLPMELNETNFNLPVELKCTKSSQHIKNSIKNTGAYMDYMPHKNAILTFKTSILRKLFSYEKSGYHSVPPILIHLILNYGMRSVKDRYGSDDCINHFCYGLYAKPSYSRLNISDVPLFSRTLSYKVKQACILTERYRKLNERVIFHVGFHKTGAHNNIFAKIKQNILPQDECEMLANIDLRKKLNLLPLRVDIRAKENTFSFRELNRVYPSPIVKSLNQNNNKALLMFPCSRDSFFIITSDCIDA